MSSSHCRFNLRIGSAALVLLGMAGSIGLRADSIAADGSSSLQWTSNPFQIGNGYVALESSLVNLSSSQPAGWGGQWPDYPRYLFSGYLTPWSSSLENNFGALSVQQLLVENLTQSFGSLAGYSVDDLAGIEASFFTGETTQHQLLAHVAIIPATSALALQAVGPPTGESVPTSVPEPVPNTLVLLGCGVVAVSLGLANRNRKNSELPRTSEGCSWRDI